MRSRVTPSSPPTSSSDRGLLPGEAVAELEHMPHARVQLPERLQDLRLSQLFGRDCFGLIRVRVLDQVSVYGVAVADRRLETDGILDELEQVGDALRRETGLGGDLLDQRVATELLRQDSPRARDAPDLVDDVNGQADGPPLVGDRARRRPAGSTRSRRSRA